MCDPEISFSARGMLIKIYSSSPIIQHSKLLNAIVERWNADSCTHYLDIEPQAFHFLIDMVKHRMESLTFPSKINKKLTKLYYTKFVNNPQIISGSIYLELNFQLEEWFIKSKWSCSNTIVSFLNNNLDKNWHYVDCLIYIVYMLEEQQEDKATYSVSIKRGHEDIPKCSEISAKELSIQWFNDNKKICCDTFTLGTQNIGSYANQYDRIQYRSFDNIVNLFMPPYNKDITPEVKKYYEKIVELMPAYNNPKLRNI
jgi:hypothetical protein